jgi:hypothetical protein
VDYKTTWTAVLRRAVPAQVRSPMSTDELTTTASATHHAMIASYSDDVGGFGYVHLERLHACADSDEFSPAFST